MQTKKPHPRRAVIATHPLFFLLCLFFEISCSLGPSDGDTTARESGAAESPEISRGDCGEKSNMTLGLQAKKKNADANSDERNGDCVCWEDRVAHSMLFGKWKAVASETRPRPDPAGLFFGCDGIGAAITQDGMFGLTFHYVAEGTTVTIRKDNGFNAKADMCTEKGRITLHADGLRTPNFYEKVETDGHNDWEHGDVAIGNVGREALEEELVRKCLTRFVSIDKGPTKYIVEQKHFIRNKITHDGRQQVEVIPFEGFLGAATFKQTTEATVRVMVKNESVEPRGGMSVWIERSAFAEAVEGVGTVLMPARYCAYCYQVGKEKALLCESFEQRLSDVNEFPKRDERGAF